MLKGDGFRLDYTAGGADLYDMGWKAVTAKSVTCCLKEVNPFTR